MLALPSQLGHCQLRLVCQIFNMSKTSKPKRVEIIRHKETRIIYRNEYTCPSCKTNFYNSGPDIWVTRFKCECGQELIVYEQR